MMLDGQLKLTMHSIVGSKPTKKKVEEAVDRLVFVLYNLKEQ